MGVSGVACCMRIFGLTVGRNEAGRYLETMLWHMHGIVDNHFFFDDRSDDETVSIAEDTVSSLCARCCCEFLRE